MRENGMTMLFRASVLLLSGAAVLNLWAADTPPKTRLAEVEDIQLDFV